MGILPDSHQYLLRRRLFLFATLITLLILLAAAWSWTPIRSWLDVDLAVSALRSFGRAFGMVAAVCGFALALVVAIPLVFLTLVALVAFGPAEGFACVAIGALIGAACSYCIGNFLGREVLQRMGGERINRLSHRLAHHGILAVILVRLVPVAPFAVVNMVAGASHIRLRDLLLGTAIGIMPGTLALMAFVDQITAALGNPTPITFALVALTVLLIGVGVWGLRRWLRADEQL